MSLNDVMKVTLYGLSFSKQTVNVFHYIDTGVGSTAGAQDLYTVFQAVIPDAIADVLALGSIFTSIRVEQVVGGSDFYEQGFAAIEGTVSADSLPPFVTWTFKYIRSVPGFRHGYKRFSGVPETLQQGGTITAGAVTPLADLADELEGSLGSANGGIWEPIIAYTELNGEPRDPAVYLKPLGVTFDKIGTQSTRKD